MRLPRTPSHAGRDWLERPAAVAIPLTKNASDRRGRLPARSCPVRSSGTGWRGEAPRCLGRRWRWLEAALRSGAGRLPTGQARPVRARLAEFLRHDPGFQRGCQDPEGGPQDRDRPGPFARSGHGPRGRPAGPWRVPEITTPERLADRLEIDLAHLEWLADCQGRERAARREPLRNYRYRWIKKASGSLRLIESPKPTAEADPAAGCSTRSWRRSPPHDAAHGFRPGRSVATFVAPHAGRRVVLKMDLRDFFPSITAARVVAIFLTAGYPEDVARLLAGLCTNTVPIAVTRAIDTVPSGPEPRRLAVAPALRASLTCPRGPDLAGPGQPLRLPPRRPPRRPGPCGGGLLHARMPTTWSSPETTAFARGVEPVREPRRRDRAGGGVRGPAPQDAGDAPGRPPAGRRGRPQQPPERPSRRIRRAQGHPAQLRAVRPREPEPRRTPRLPGPPPGRIAHVAGLNPQRARRLEAIFERIAW